MGPNKSFIILVKNVISLPYSVQRKKAYVLINFTILSASKNPCANPLLFAFPFTLIYMNPCSSSPSILFPFSISIDEREESFVNELGDSNGDAGDGVWRGLATEVATGDLDNNELGVGVGVVKLEDVLIKNMY